MIKGSKPEVDIVCIPLVFVQDWKGYSPRYWECCQKTAIRCQSSQRIPSDAGTCLKSRSCLLSGHPHPVTGYKNPASQPQHIIFSRAILSSRVPTRLTKASVKTASGYSFSFCSVLLLFLPFHRHWPQKHSLISYIRSHHWGTQPVTKPKARGELFLNPLEIQASF